MSLPRRATTITPLARRLARVKRGVRANLPVPARSMQTEMLDAHISNTAELAANLADLRTVNRWLGGYRSIIRAVAPSLATLPPRHHQATPPTEDAITLLDVGTGSGDVPLALRAWARQQGLPMRFYAADLLREVLEQARDYTGQTVPLVCHNALAAPYPDATFDILTCHQTLHHFNPPEAIALLRELARIARHVVIISDLRRSWAGYGGAHLLATVQRSAMSRHDGPLSVLRAYTPAETAHLSHQAGLPATVSPDGLFRMTMVINLTRQ